MSGELQIVFIYDTLSVKKEEDDPKDAILYFHPDCIPEERRIAICGQLMGITHFLRDTFSSPKILTLDNGKFAMRKFGRQYVLALGCSSVTPDWLLEKQADILYKLTIFFHRDIKTILQSVNGDRLRLSSRLSLIMDHYIPISQHHGDLFALTFGILPILNLPKSANNISLSASVLLQSCIMQNGVLGGMVMYQNKVIGVELAQELAQKLAFIQPYQLPPAEPVRLQFACPPGVQIFTIFIDEDELMGLRKHSSTFQYPSNCEPKVTKNKEGNQKGKIDPIREEDPSDLTTTSIGFTDLSSKGTSELENSEAESQDTGKGASASSEKVTSSSNNQVSSIIPPDTKLKFEEFLKAAQKGKHGPHHSSHKIGNLVVAPPPCVHMNGCGPNSLKSLRESKSLENLSLAETTLSDTPPPLPMQSSCFCASLTDPHFPFIRCDGKSISKALLDVYAGSDECVPCNEEDKENAEVDVEVEAVKKSEDLDATLDGKPIAPSNTLNKPQPSIPNGSMSTKMDDSEASNKDSPGLDSDVQKTDEGIKIAQTSPEVSLNSVPLPRRPMDLPLNSKKYSRKKSKRRWSTFEDMMSPVVDTPSRASESFPAVIPNVNENWKISASEVQCAKTNPSHQELYSSFRKLSSHDEFQRTKSLTDSSSEDNTLKMNGTMINFNNPSLSGKVVTERTANDFGSITLSKSGNKNFAHQELDRYEKSAQQYKPSYETQNHIRSSLFIYSLGSMRLLLLLEKDKSTDSELVQTLWEYGSSRLSEIETAISNVEEQTMSTTASQHDHYCYLHYEAVWRSLAHGGRNHSMDFDVVQQMHQDFNVYPNISELIIRGEDHVVYGYQCVGSEVFYQQSAGLQPGLPMPSDLMGKVPFKAKRRLERDHNILLL